jgi:hypothetical protein
MSNNATCTTLYNNFKNIFQIVTPGPRNQIVSPYTNSTLDVSGTRNALTQQDLNMRRKAEILQYNKNGSNNAKISKKQNYSRIAKGVKNYTATANNQACNTTYNLLTPTYASDVPGPLQFLTYKPEVPLYMYAMNTTAFNENETENTLFFHDINKEYKCNNNVLTQVFSMINMNPKNIEGYLNLSIPIGIFAEGTTVSGAEKESIFLSGVEMIIRSNRDNSILNVTYDTNIQKINNNGILFDTSSNGYFIAQQKIGLLEIYNIDIDVSVYSIYDFYFKFTVETNMNGSYENLNVGIVTNILGNGYNNCEKYFYTNLPIYSKFHHYFNDVLNNSFNNFDFANLFRVNNDDVFITYNDVPVLRKGEYYADEIFEIYYVNNYYCYKRNNIITFFKIEFLSN